MTNRDREHTIWSDENLDLKDWRDDILAEEPDLTEDELYNRMVELNSEYLDDERDNLREAIISTPILLVAELGLWDGTHYGYRTVESGRIADCLSSREDGPKAWFVDAKGEFRARIHHHDGMNCYWYRGIRPDASEAALERLQALIYNREEYEPLLRRLTYRLGDIIGDVYGWQFPHRPKCSVVKEG